MNLMSKWVKMVNEGTYNFPEENDDVSRTERGELGADDYEEQQNLLADIQKANEKYEKSKTVREAEESEENNGDEEQDVPELTDDERSYLKVPNTEEHDAEFWKGVEDSLNKIKDRAVRLNVINTLRKVLDDSKKSPIEGPQKAEIERRMNAIVNDINNGSDDDASVEKSVRELEDLLNTKFRTDLAKDGQIKTGVKGATRTVKEEPTQKKWIVFNRMLVTKSNASREQIEKAKNDPDFWSDDGKDQFFQRPTVEMDILETPMFDTEKEAGDYVSEQLSKFANKFRINLKLQDVANIEDPKAPHWQGFVRSDTTKKDITNNYKQTADGKKGEGVTKKVSEYDAIPTPIKRVDPNAFGFMYTDYEDKKDNPRTFHVEIIVYRATKPVNYTDGLDELWDAWNNANNPDWKGIEKDREERRRQYDMQVQDLDKAITDSEKEHYTKEIEKDMVTMFNKDKDNDVLEILKTVKELKDKSDDELLNLTAEDFVPLSLNKIKYIYGKLEWAAKQKKVNDEDDEDNDKDVELATDDEILAAAEEERELAKMKKDMEDGKSIDGYATRGDEKKADKERREDTEAAEKEEQKNRDRDERAERIEGDADDYEGGQEGAGIGDRTFSTLKGQQSTVEKSTSSQGLHGVPLTKKEFQFLMDRYMKNGKPTSEWPKNAKEVKELKKKIKAEISGN